MNYKRFYLKLPKACFFKFFLFLTILGASNTWAECPTDPVSWNYYGNNTNCKITPPTEPFGNALVIHIESANGASDFKEYYQVGKVCNNLNRSVYFEYKTINGYWQQYRVTSNSTKNFNELGKVRISSDLGIDVIDNIR